MPSFHVNAPPLSPTDPRRVSSRELQQFGLNASCPAPPASPREEGAPPPSPRVEVSSPSSPRVASPPPPLLVINGRDGNVTLNHTRVNAGPQNDALTDANAGISGALLIGILCSGIVSLVVCVSVILCVRQGLCSKKALIVKVMGTRPGPRPTSRPTSRPRLGETRQGVELQDIETGIKAADNSDDDDLNPDSRPEVPPAVIIESLVGSRVERARAARLCTNIRDSSINESIDDILNRVFQEIDRIEEFEERKQELGDLAASVINIMWKKYKERHRQPEECSDFMSEPPSAVTRPLARKKLTQRVESSESDAVKAAQDWLASLVHTERTAVYNILSNQETSQDASSSQGTNESQKEEKIRRKMQVFSEKFNKEDVFKSAFDWLLTEGKDEVERLSRPLGVVEFATRKQNPVDDSQVFKLDSAKNLQSVDASALTSGATSIREELKELSNLETFKARRQAFEERKRASEKAAESRRLTLRPDMAWLQSNVDKSANAIQRDWLRSEENVEFVSADILNQVIEKLSEKIQKLDNGNSTKEGLVRLLKFLSLQQHNLKTEQEEFQIIFDDVKQVDIFHMLIKEIEEEMSPDSELKPVVSRVRASLSFKRRERIKKPDRKSLETGSSSGAQETDKTLELASDLTSLRDRIRQLEDQSGTAVECVSRKRGKQPLSTLEDSSNSHYQMELKGLKDQLQTFISQPQHNEGCLERLKAEVILMHLNQRVTEEEISFLKKDLSDAREVFSSLSAESSTASNLSSNHPLFETALTNTSFSDQELSLVQRCDQADKIMLIMFILETNEKLGEVVLSERREAEGVRLRAWRMESVMGLVKRTHSFERRKQEAFDGRSKLNNDARRFRDKQSAVLTQDRVDGISMEVGKNESSLDI